MADISSEIAAFRDAAYGEEVRGSMISLANKLNNNIVNEISSMENTWDSYKDSVDDVIEDFESIVASAFYFGVAIPDGTDLNTIIGPRFGFLNNAFQYTNSPLTNTRAFLYSIGDTVRTQQFIMTFVSNEIQVYYRLCASGSWGKWMLLYDNPQAVHMTGAIFSSRQESWNLLSNVDFNLGKDFSNDGSIVDSTYYSVSELIPVFSTKSSNVWRCFSMHDPDHKIHKIVTYNANKDVSRIIDNVDTFWISRGEAYIRVSVHNDPIYNGSPYMCYMTQMPFNDHHFTDYNEPINTGLFYTPKGPNLLEYAENFGIGFYRNGSLVANNDFIYFGPIDVTDYQNKTLIWGLGGLSARNASSNGLRFLDFKDADDNEILTQSYEAKIQGTHVIVPSNAKYLYASYGLPEATPNFSEYWITPISQPVFFNEFKIPGSMIEGTPGSKDYSSINFIKHPFDGLHTRRLATINFQFDDNDEQDINIYNLCKEYGIRCGFAFIASQANINDLTLVNRYLSWQDEGFEILSHSVDGTPMGTNDSSVDEIDEKMLLSKQRLTNAGFKVRGWVTPSSDLNSAYYGSVRKYYDFASTIYRGVYDAETAYYVNKDYDTSLLFRLAFEGNTASDINAAIDDAISHNGFMTMYGHSYNLTSDSNIQKIRDVFSHVVEAQSTSDIVILTPSRAVDYYFHVRQSDLT